MKLAIEFIIDAEHTEALMKHLAWAENAQVDNQFFGKLQRSLLEFHRDNHPLFDGGREITSFKSLITNSGITIFPQFKS